MNKRVTAGTGVSLGALLALPAVAQAEDFRVTNLNSDGPGSLRQANEDAYENQGADRVVFKSKLSGTITLTDVLGYSTLYIPYNGEDLEIVGPGARKVTVEVTDDDPVMTPWNTTGSSFDVSISGLTIAGGNGEGGIQVVGATNLTLDRVAVRNNETPGNGGGVGAISDAGNPTLVIENSTISQNSADGNGGGIFMQTGDFTMVNSTVSGNSAPNEGGGISLNDGGNSDDIRNSTITGNTGGIGGGVYEGSEGATVRGSIIAGNSAVNFDDLEGGEWPISFSIVGTDDDPDITDQGGNILDVDPKLKPLKNNGGPTDTHAFKKSPAKNKGPSDAPNSDQRGAPRKGKADIGAYELVKCEGVIVNRVGTAGRDKLKGTKRKDGILGLGGNDKLAGKKGKDGLCGGQGKDKLKGGPGKDKLNGGPGKDKEVQ
jgi:predicted outer membrane repeat protein